VADLPLWMPAAQCGDVGAAALPLAVLLADAAFRRGYAPGHLALASASDGDGRYGALLIGGTPTLPED
jgi:3-oxoacyl-[acyl-carrier-protein] synthase-1